MPNNGYLYSKLEKNIDVEVKEPLKEYPRPNFKRNSYYNLNGEWNYVISKSKETPSKSKDIVVVPYAIESPLSKVNHSLEVDEFIYYFLDFKIPQEILNKDRVIINFDGVDQSCDLYINNNYVGSHCGGYTKFYYNIKKYVTSNINSLILRVKDVTDTSYHMRGKQVLNPSGWFYSSSSGIYKSVWLEGVDEKRINAIKLTPLFDEGSVEVLVNTSDEGSVDLKIENQNITIKSNTKITIKLDEFHPWNIASPYLYQVKAKFFDDEVESYFGLRKIEVRKEENPGIYLNNKRIIINGLLDQGYYYLGGLTPRSYNDYEEDVKNTLKLGYNCLRKHIKIECDMFYYYCDKYGLLVIQDFPCGGTPYIFINCVIPRINIKLFNKEKYCTYKKYSRTDKLGRNEFIKEVKEIMATTYNFPSVIIYTIFNEGWGEFDPSLVYKELKKLDPTHLFDTASGWLDSSNSDLFSIHSYTFPSLTREDKKDHRPYILSEIGGAGFKVEGHYFYPKVYGHHVCTSLKALNKRYYKLYSKLIKKMKKGILNGVIYTELNDCETECNGIYTLDRKYFKLDEKMVIDLNEEIKDIYK